MEHDAIYIHTVCSSSRGLKGYYSALTEKRLGYHGEIATKGRKGTCSVDEGQEVRGLRRGKATLKSTEKA